MNVSGLLKVSLTLAIVVAFCTDVSGQILRSVDVFGSDQVESGDIRDNWGEDIEELVLLLKNHDRPGFEAKRKELIDVIGQSGVYSFVDISVYEQFLPEYGGYVTVDLVDPLDADIRLGYDEAPVGSPADPDSLIARWLEYDATARRIRDEEGAPPSSCNAFHCLWGYNHAQLAPFGDYFRSYISANERGIVDVLHSHRDERHREAAIFLLAHGHSQKQLLEYVESALTDASPRVRAAALEVMSSLSEGRPDLISIDDVLHFLRAPTARERAAGLKVLSNISGPIVTREKILIEGGHALIAMMRLEQPSNSLPAYELLKRVSGRSDLSQFDYDSWTGLVDTIVALVNDSAAGY